MNFVRCALLLLVGSAVCLGQSGGGFSFGGKAGPRSQSHFGLDAPGFPDTSARRLDLETGSSSAPVTPELPYAYPVRPSRPGKAPANVVLAAPGSAGGRFLILVFRNQTVESSSACSIEGQVLHYVTAAGSSRTIPIKRVNWKLTEETNSIRTGTLIPLLKKIGS
jgi:hypothetical protein